MDAVYPQFHLTPAFKKAQGMLIAVQRSPPKITAAAIEHKLINAIIQTEIAHKNTPRRLV